ncbi:MAG: restriction endonuclease subunit S [Candidatus Accumulibacter phosphatis]|uniref:Restriction endonuclease subunit S n=1 Tax=Candidatus Accumulibacter phosphatis TaxID=327160 RepID=A0A6A7RSG4_9PROT|nr:restriction endonuclease subunit S [Candidatus Accumulibacter phosphatis]
MTDQLVRLGDVADMLVGFSFKSQDFLEASATGVKLVRGDNVQQGSIRWGSKAKKWRGDSYGDFERYQLRLDDVVLAMDRPIVGGGLKLAWVKEQDLPCLLVQRVTRIRGITGVALTNYLRYALSAPDFASHIHRITTGANIPHISGRDIASFQFKLPAIAEQERMVEQIAPYDDLIETNRRRITLLEESARLLYREWFVNLRFPGYQLLSLIDGLPENWHRTKYGDIVDAIGGATPSTKRPDYWDGDIGWLTPTDVTRNDCLYLSDSVRKITETGYDSCSAKLLPAGTIFMTSRASIGYFALLDKPACTNQGFIAIVPKVHNTRNFLLFNLMNRVDELEAKATGSTFKELGKRTFREMMVVLPSEDVLGMFEAVIQPIIEQVTVLKKQLIALTCARDELLPRLMSGAIRV